MAEYFGAGEDAIYLSGMAAGAATKKGVIGYVVPFAIPEVIRHANAFALGAQATHPRREGEAHLDELVVRPGQGEEGGGEPPRRRRRRDRAERRQPGRRPVRRVGEDPVGRLRLEREEVRAEVVADGGRLQLGPVLRSSASKAAMNGTWKTGFYYGSMKDGFTRLAPFGPASRAKTKAAIAAKQRR